MSTHYDVIIIGTGAGGGTLFHALAPTGKRILLLERGGYVPREKANWSTRAVNLEGRYNTKEVWRDRDGSELHPHTNYYVGGNTKFYGAALFRLRREDFGEVRHHGGISPAWPITYEDLEPYYTQAEALYHVHGERGEDPTDPPAQRAVSASAGQPRAAHPAAGRRLCAAGPAAVSHAARGDARRARSAQEPVHSLRDLRRASLPGRREVRRPGPLRRSGARADPNVTLLTGGLVTRLETSPSGREVTGVVVERDGATETYSADIVVVSAGAINSAALLLRSASDRHPQGLANGSDVVGRHYMGHVNSVLMAISKCPNPTVFQKTLSAQRLLLGLARMGVPDGPHLLRRQARRRHARARAPRPSRPAGRST